MSALHLGWTLAILINVLVGKDFMMTALLFAKVIILFNEECSYKCLNCVGSKDNCTFCFINLGYYRDNISP